MADVLVTFEDGTTELRPANSFAHWSEPGRLGPRIADSDIVAAFRGGYPLHHRRGVIGATVWVITGQAPETKALTGEWRRCRVETVEEQIERLTRERDAARRIAVLGRAPLTAENDAELQALVARAKQERWLT